MAYDNPGPKEDEDLYESGGDEKGGAKYDEGKDQYAAATLPKSILAGKKFDVGDEVVLKITHMGDEEITVTYATGEKEEGTEKEEAPEEPPPGEPQGEMVSAGGDYE